MCKKYNASDHHTIRYNLETELIQIPPSRNYEKADWNLFKEDLETFEVYTPDIITQYKLHKMVNKVTAKITQALDKACPMQEQKIINKNNPWWTTQLKNLRKEVSTLYRRMIRKKDDSLENPYKELHRKYKNLCNKRKKTKWKRTQESVPDEEKMSNLDDSHKTKYVKFLVDSQAALLALNNTVVKSRTVLKTIVNKEGAWHMAQLKVPGEPPKRTLFAIWTKTDLGCVCCSKKVAYPFF